MTRLMARVSGLAVIAAFCMLTSDVFGHGTQAPTGAAATAAPAAAPAGAPSGAPSGAPGGATGGGQGGATGGGGGGATGGGGFGGGTGGTGGIKKAAGGAGRIETNWGKNNRSPNVARILDIHFVDAEWPSAKSEGYDARTMPLWYLIHDKCFDSSCTDLHCKHDQCNDMSCMRDKKPAMIYIYDTKLSREKKLESEMAMFGSDDIAALSNFVHSFHMAAEEVEMGEYTRNFGTKLPALIFIAPNGTTVGRLEGDITKAEVTAQFSKVFETCYATDMAKRLSDYKECLKKLEKSEDEMATVGTRVRDLELRLREKPESALSAKLEEAKAKSDSVSKAWQEAEAERRALLSLKFVGNAPKETASK